MTGPGRVAILMGLCNGAAHLQDPLDSFVAQTVPDWDLTVSDDGSGDDGPAILARFAEAQEAEGRMVRLVAGPGQGFSVNFLSLLASVPDGTDWVALSDQDDVWLPDRLHRGQRALCGVSPETPALYGSASWIVDEDLTGHRASPLFHRPPSFRNALVQSIAGGNTMLLNRSGVDLARAAAAEALSVGGPATHDWWLYQLVSGAGGQVIRDETQTILYRQHGQNQYGSNRGLGAAVSRLRQVFSGDLGAWVAQNNRALGASAHRLTAENRALLDRFSRLRTQHIVARVQGFRGLGLYRQGRAGQVAISFAAALGRL